MNADLTQAQNRILCQLGKRTTRSIKLDGNARYPAQRLKELGLVDFKVVPPIESGRRILPLRKGGHTVEIWLTQRGVAEARKITRET